MTISSLPVTPSETSEPQRSVFTGTDVCLQAGLALPEGIRRPVFDDDVWDFTHVIGLPVQMRLACRRFDFAAITDPRWRLVGKELIFAMLVPRHEAVAPLSRAYRTALHLSTAGGRLIELTGFLDWLTERDIAGLGDIDASCCEEYLAGRRYVRDRDDIVVGELSPATRRSAAQIVVDLVNYRELFTADRVAADLRPWGGATASAIAEMPSGRTMNKTPPVEDSVLQPLLAAALYLVSAFGPHAVELNQQVTEADRRWSRKASGLLAPRQAPAAQIRLLLGTYERDGRPLPLLPDRHLQDRLRAGSSPDDPLAPIATDLLARQAGYARFRPDWIPELRDAIEATLGAVGAEKYFARRAADVERADGEGILPWTPPLHRLQAVALVGVVRTAAITILAAVSGMRSSELMELQVGCRRPAEESGPGLVRYRLASKVIKGQPLGGTRDEWVVIEPVFQAAGLAEQLCHDPRDGALLFGRFAFDVRYKWLRNWVNGPSGQRIGLTPIPGKPVSLRALRRTLAIELAYRPGGMLAAKLHMRHISVATTEGYASRPGGAQAELLAEVNKHESERNLNLVWAEFRNYQQGIMPAGPGARELTEFFACVDAELVPADAGTAKVQRSDREILSLLAKRAKILHLGTANYCSLKDPCRAVGAVLPVVTGM